MYFRSEWNNQVTGLSVLESNRHVTYICPPPSPPPSPLSFHTKPDPAPRSKYEHAEAKLLHSLQSNQLTRQFFPPKGNTAVVMTLVIGVVAIFLVFRSVLGATASPGGAIFSLLVLILLCVIVGQAVKITIFLLFKFCKLNIRFPPFIAMLGIGILLRNVPYNFSQYQRPACYVTINNTELHVFSINLLIDPAMADSFNLSASNISNETVKSTTAAPASPDESCKPRYIGRDLDPAISGICRSTCLAVILLLAGLELDPVALHNLSGLFVSGTLIPCIVEMTTATILARYILGFDWLVAAVLGVLLTGISAAVVIPSVVQLTNANYGVAKGIPTLAIAICASTDAFAIAGLGILTGIYFDTSEASLARLILQGPIEIIVGFLFGYLWGGIVKYLPDKDHHNLKFFRWLLLLCGGLISIFGTKVIGYEGAGGVATVVGAYLANKKWRELGWEEHNDTEKNLKKMWIVLSPVIFGLVGTEVQIDKLNGHTVALGFAVLIITVVVRTIAAYFSMWTRKFNWKEMLFLALAWVSKATVQAAIGEN